MKKKYVFLLIILVSFFTTLQAQNILYVNKNVSGGTADGSSWANAIPELADALVWAKQNEATSWATTPLQIWVAGGTYKPLYSPEDGTNFGTNQGRSNSFLMVNNVQVYGGFAGTETALADRDLSLTANATTLSGDFNDDDVITGAGSSLSFTNNTENAYHVLICSGDVGSASLDGFTIIGGNANDFTYQYVNGIMIDTFNGGGMHNASSLIITNTTFSGNYGYNGGGMFNNYFSLVITNTNFSENIANYGGGMLNFYNSAAVITNSTFSGNNAVYGGGMCNESSSLDISNNTFIGNSAKYSSDVMANFYNSSLNIYNSIVWGEIYNYSSTPDIEYSLVQGNTDTSNGNLDATGLTETDIFTDPTNGDYTLKDSSVAINAASNTLYTSVGGDLTNDVDIAGNARLVGSTLDIGAYENQPLQLVPDTSNIVYVNKNVSGGTADGSSWANAIPELADALVWAKQNEATSWATTPLQIWVAGGTYKPLYSPEDGANFGTNQGRSNSFLMVNNVQVYGGFASTETALADRDLSLTANATTLSGDFNDDDVITGAGSSLSFTNNTENAYHVLISSGDVGTALLDGFSVAGGNASSATSQNINGNLLSNSVGGGMYNHSSSLVITNTTFSGNNADSYGGGMVNYNSSPVIANTTFSGNDADSRGGGMINYGSSSPVITNTTFSGNSATFYGGGMYNDSSSPVITNTTFSGNDATENGGGMYNYSSSPVITNITFSENYADIGGGMFNYSASPVITNTTFIGNDATFSGGMYSYSSSLKIYNSIVWGDLSDNSSTPDIQYSLIEGSSDTSNGNLDATGLTETDIFEDPTNGDYSLKDSSVAINAGSNTLYTNAGGDLTNDVDLASNTRVFQNTIDIGAYENQTLQLVPDTNNILYVDKNVSGGTADGSSWANAIPELADALVWANNNKANFTTTPLQIWVAGGTYKPLYSPEDGANFGTNQGRSNAFLMVNNVQVYGGFAGTETALANRDLSITANNSILSGDFNDDDVITGAGSSLSFTNNTENAYHVLISSGDVGTALLDGFTITGGNANSATSQNINGNTLYSYSGGGMYNNSSSPDITNTTFSGNNADTFGGGMNNYFSFPVITNTTFSRNNTSYYGGGMNNSSSSPVITNTTFSGNFAGYGGVMYNSSSSPVITNTTFSGNYATYFGGGMHNQNNSSPVITNTTFSGNAAGYSGDGMYNDSSSPVITNTTFSGNNATNNGGGIYNSSSSLKIYNSIVWGELYSNSFSSTLDIQYSLIEGSSDTSNGNLDATGLTETDIFADPTNGDYSLKDSSVAINAGSNTLYTNAGGDLTNDVDLASNTRVFQNTIDIGAYENQTLQLVPDTNNILYVNKNVSGGTADGSSWANAIPELADALVWAKQNEATSWATTPLQIWVAGGTYKPLYSPEDGANFGTNQGRSNAFLMVNNVQVYGGFAGIETALADRDLSLTANNSILSGDFDSNDVITGAGSNLSFTNNTENAYHVLISSGDVGTALLDGFSVAGGYAHVSGGTSSIYINGNVILPYYGGGMYNNSSSPSVTNTTFSGSSAIYSGGGMYNYSSSPVITNTTFSGNAGNSGGGMYNEDASSPDITNTTFSGNAAAYGGGMYNYSSSPVITNTTFSENYADTGGGMFNYSSSPTIINTIFSGNFAAYSGGGMFNNSSSSPVITNTTFSGNNATNSGGGIHYSYHSIVKIYNSIIWGEVSNTHSTPDIQYSLIEGSSDTSNGNLDATGLTETDIFADPTNGDYSLKDSSVAINAGSNALYTNAGGDLTNDVDIAGNARLVSSTIDMGAYETQNTPPTANCQDLTVYLDENGSVTILPEDIDNGSSDNESTVSLSLDITDFDCDNLGDNIVTLTVTDTASSTDTCTATVTVKDNTAPVADATTLSDITAECEVLATNVTAPTATDNCGGTVTVTNDASFPITTQGTTVITWAYTDVNGNSSTQTQNVIIDDVTAPVADAASLADVTMECEVLATNVTAPTATDNCGGTVTVTNDATFPITTQGTTVITWTYTDVNGNFSTQTQNVIIDDVTAPVADATTLSDITAECEVLATNVTAPTATDNCGGTVTVTNDATFPITTQGTTVITWTYNDVNGNFSTQTQNVIIDDVTAPVADATTLSNITAECEVLATNVTAPTATDNCGGTVTVTNDATFPITTQGTTVITWTYNDGNGNTSTQTQNVIVDDVTAPVADAASLADVTMECEVLASDVTKTTATDNCGGIVTVTNDATFPITTQGTTVITWTYTDVNGNSSTQTQNINVLASPISVVTFNDKTVTYNGNLHSIMVNNLPTDASVTYSISPSGTTTNGATDAGIYTVTAVVTPPATAVNCDPITLTATLTIEQAPQTITFNPLAIMVLEDDPDFQLQAIASSGLAVDYTYTYTSANPPATVSSTGWVDLLTSGLVDITAHQAGNANYLPATSVMQTLQINSRDASAHSIEIEDEVYSSPSNEIYYLIACEDAFNAVTVTFETETNASVNPSHNFTIETPIPGIYREEIIITSQDGSTTETYLITVEKMFSFSDIVEQKFDNVLLVNNNPSTNGGYSFVAYEWYKDDQIISVDQYYSAGPSTLDLLDPSAEYYVRMETTEGDILQTCIGSITLEHDFSASIFPNPNESGSVLNIELEGLEISSAELLNINLYSLQGAKVGHWVSDRNFTTVKLPETLATGVYIVNCTADNKTYNFKLIIE